jgi:hypothetical protein
VYERRDRNLTFCLPTSQLKKKITIKHAKCSWSGKRQLLCAKMCPELQMSFLNMALWCRIYTGK